MSWFNVGLCCKNCNNLLCKEQDICFFCPTEKDVHLALRPQSVGRIMTSTIIKLQNDCDNAKSRKFNPFVYKCKCCYPDGGKIGSAFRIDSNIENTAMVFAVSKVKFINVANKKEYIHPKSHITSKKGKMKPKDLLTYLNIKKVGIAGMIVNSDQQLNQDDSKENLSIKATKLNRCNVETLTFSKDIDGLTQTTPKNYQLEAFIACLATNTIVSIPTGTVQKLF